MRDRRIIAADRSGNIVTGDTVSEQTEMNCAVSSFRKHGGFLYIGNKLLFGGGNVNIAWVTRSVEFIIALKKPYSAPSKTL